jgi:hypothetical protein
MRGGGMLTRQGEEPAGDLPDLLRKQVGHFFFLIASLKDYVLNINTFIFILI